MTDSSDVERKSNSSSDAGDAAALVPSSSAAHAFIVTTSQNVAREVQERIDEIRAGTRRTGVGAVGSVIATAAAVAGAFLTGDSGIIATAVLLGLYGGGSLVTAALAFYGYRRRALGQAELLDRKRDVSWVSPTEGLVFFSDDGVYVEKKGGFRPYGVNERRFRDASVSESSRSGRRRLTLHGQDWRTGASYELDIDVPKEWSDGDTTRVQAKLDAFAAG